MTVRTVSSLLAAAAAIAVSACSNNGSLNSTASLSPDKQAVAAPSKIDPACASLAAQIDTLRQEGSIERLEKAADGKTASVQVKRTSLAKQAELNRANADFQAKCAPNVPKVLTTQAAPVTPVATTSAPAKAANTPAPKPAPAVVEKAPAPAAAPAATPAQ